MSNYTYCVCGFGFDAAMTSGTHSCPAADQPPWITKDSGERQLFESGMVRDTQRSKIRYDLVYLPMFKRWAELMGRGAQKYGDNNWKKADSQAELDRFKESAFRHFMTWFLNEDNNEDHCAATWFNMSGVEYLKGEKNVEEVQTYPTKYSRSRVRKNKLKGETDE